MKFNAKVLGGVTLAVARTMVPQIGAVEAHDD